MRPGKTDNFEPLLKIRYQARSCLQYLPSDSLIDTLTVNVTKLSPTLELGVEGLVPQVLLTGRPCAALTSFNALVVKTRKT